jgi:catechol 2,3-dioxygenase-like lactoylglutathione lyase family enzyme
MASAPRIAPELDDAELNTDYFLSPEEARRQFEDAVRRRMGMSSDEFIRRYEAGEYCTIADQSGFLYIGDLISLIPIARDWDSISHPDCSEAWAEWKEARRLGLSLGSTSTDSAPDRAVESSAIDEKGAATDPEVRSVLNSIRNVDYVVLLCKDLVVMREFYEGVMGFPIYRDQDGWIELRVGSTLLTLRRRDRPYDGPTPRDSACVQLAFRVTPAEVDACHAELVAKGVPILDPPADQPWGHRTLFFQDPERNVLEIYADL